jgi:hypothetical protein
VIELSFVKEAAGLDAGNVLVMLGMLHSIHDEVEDDVVMADFAVTIALAITQLRKLQQLAYEAMIEIESERTTGRGARLRLIAKTPS